MHKKKKKTSYSKSRVCSEFERTVGYDDSPGALTGHLSLSLRLASQSCCPAGRGGGRAKTVCQGGGAPNRKRQNGTLPVIICTRSESCFWNKYVSVSVITGIRCCVFHSLCLKSVIVALTKAKMNPQPLNHNISVIEK